MTHYVIPQENLDKLTRTVEKLNQRASKLAQPLIIFQIGESRYQSMNRPDASNMPNKEMVKVYDIELEGISPIIPGWSFIAALQHEEAGNIVKTFDQELPEHYRISAPDCDHCGLDRNRKSTYVLKNQAGEFKQVGSTCLHDFTGYADIQAVAAWLENLAEFLDSIEDYEDFDYSRGGSHYVTAVDYLSYVVRQIENNKCFISRSKAESSMTTSTADRAAFTMQDNKNYPTEAQVEKAKAIITWGQDFFTHKRESRMTDYDWNCSVVIFKDMLGVRDLGLIASIASYYDREMGKIKEAELKAQTSTSNHLGEVGGKLTKIACTVTSEKSWETQWGITNLIKFLDKSGNILVWFASGYQYLNPTDQVVIERATVKAHDQYNGERQTIITRAKIEKKE